MAAKIIRQIDSFKSPIRKKKTIKNTRVRDLRRNEFNHIVCPDTGEVCRSYKSYLTSKHWRLFKKRFRESSFYTGICFICGNTVKLHHHHTTYVRLGKELLSDIVLLCGSKCHRNVHRALRKGITWDKIVKSVENI